MKRIDCLFERTSSVGVAAALLLMALGMSVIGITILPVLGLIMSLPIYFLSGLFLFSPQSKECAL
jgi:uncharacterized membrane protein YvlD (DUF360 family)